MLVETRIAIGVFLDHYGKEVTLFRVKLNDAKNIYWI